MMIIGFYEEDLVRGYRDLRVGLNYILGNDGWEIRDFRFDNSNKTWKGICIQKKLSSEDVDKLDRLVNSNLNKHFTVKKSA